MLTSGSTLWRRGILGLAVVFPLTLAFTSVSLSGAKGSASTDKSLLAGARVPTPVRSVFQRACQDCHSENTVWPWYSRVPPLSWRIHDDVKRGRAFMNLSKWNEYTEGERRGFLLAIVTATQTHIMPPPKYVWMHSNAKVSDAELTC